MNFEFVKSCSGFGTLYKYCSRAEDLLPRFPDESANASRKGLEFIVQLLYKGLTGQRQSGAGDNNPSLLDMLKVLASKWNCADETLLEAMHTVRKIGNRGSHFSIKLQDAVNCLEQLQFVVGEVLMNIGAIEEYPPFESPLQKAAPVPAPTPAPAPAAPAVDDAPVVVASELVVKYADKMRHTHFDCSRKPDDAKNRRLFIEASLAEADWPISEAKNSAWPCSAGIQCSLDAGVEVDWVLYGRDNRPLALIDYSTTVKEGPLAARKFLEKAAEVVCVKYGYKPILYYSNGFQIHCNDQLGYAWRRVFTFHSIAELELLKQRRGSMQDISNPQINDAITNRTYQKEAITSVCKAFASHRRRSLIVMATGTGKTRVSISIVDVLTKANWVKNVLFLADRTSLVRQAHKNFNKLLPNLTTSMYTGENGADDRDPNARIVFSTYQSMIRLINDETREFGIGRFDLIIIDEAHRSIFKKYGSLFEYFDALMVGLTATPRDEDDKNTYDVFGLPTDNPDYAYELEQAIADGYLVGFQVLDRTTEQLKHGIKYDDLPEEERKKLEEVGAEEFDGAKTINLGTIDVMLNDLMKTGLKVDSGDKLGKTIIFSDSHVEAEEIVQRFRKLYPHLGSDFCKLVDHTVPEALSLIDLFGERDKLPQITVSVDMLDTGIDVPDVLNLVFFKSVKSKIKFMQMVGRGTRLSPDVFGPGVDKAGFLIFDYYDNFAYFATGGMWKTGTGGGASMAIPSSTTRINKRRLSIMRALQSHPMLPGSYEESYYKRLHADFVAETRSLCNDEIDVQRNLQLVLKYRTADSWNNLTGSVFDEIVERVLPLYHSIPEDPKVKCFDCLMYIIEDEYVKRRDEGADPAKIRHGFRSVSSEIAERMDDLLKLKSIPDVLAKEELIAAFRDSSYLLDNFSYERAERIRTELRDLMAYLPKKKSYYIVDIPDNLVDDGDGQGPLNQKTYAERASVYIAEGKDIALSKLRNLDPLSEEDLQSLEETFKVRLGTEAEFETWANGAEFLPFLRKQVGIADEAIEAKLGHILHDPTLNDEQRSYLEQMVLYVKMNGDIVAKVLRERPPFNNRGVMSVFGKEHSAAVKEVVQVFHNVVSGSK